MSNPVHARLLRQFGYGHLPADLQELSRPFAKAADELVILAGRRELDPADVTVALRKLLEAKDAAVRAALQ